MNKFVTNALNIKAGKPIVVSNKKLKELRNKATNNISRHVSRHFDFEVGGGRLLLSFLNEGISFKPEDRILEFNYYYFINKLYSHYFKDFDECEDKENMWSTLCGSLFPYLIEAIYDELVSLPATFDKTKSIASSIYNRFRGDYVSGNYRETMLFMNYEAELQRKSYFYIRSKIGDITDFIINISYMLKDIKFQNQLSFIDKYISAFLNVLETDIDLEFGLYCLKTEVINGKNIFKASSSIYEIGDGYEIKISSINGHQLFGLLSDCGSLGCKIFHFPKENKPNLVTWSKDLENDTQRPEEGFYSIEIKHNGKVLDFGKTEARINYLVPYLYFIPFSVIRELKDKDNKVIELRMVIKRNDYKETYEVLEDSYLTIDLSLLFNKLKEIDEMVKGSKNTNVLETFSLRNLSYGNMFKELSEAYDKPYNHGGEVISKIHKLLQNVSALVKVESRKKDEIKTHVEKLSNLYKRFDEISNCLEVGHMNKELFETMFISIDKLYDILMPYGTDNDRAKIKVVDKINKVYEAIMNINNLI